MSPSNASSPPEDVTLASPFKTLIPARMDRLPWSRFHWLVVFALGITWVLDGLEVTLKGAISGVLQEAGTLHFTSDQIGLIASFYLMGTGDRYAVMWGYLAGAILMLAAAAVEVVWGVNAERKSLESVAQPLSVEK